jgi:hypothetical protein
MDGFDIDEIDDVIHGRVRLGMMAYLSSARTAEFGEHPAATSGYVSKNHTFQIDRCDLDHLRCRRAP